MNSALTPASRTAAARRPGQQPLPPPRLNSANDFLFALFRHKKMIAILRCSVLSPPPRSISSIRRSINRDAKLLVRYVLDRSAIDSIDGSQLLPLLRADRSIPSSVRRLQSSPAGTLRCRRRRRSAPSAFCRIPRSRRAKRPLPESISQNLDSDCHQGQQHHLRLLPEPGSGAGDAGSKRTAQSILY